MPAILTGDQLAAAAIHMVSNFDPTRLPRTDLTAALTAFLEPLTTEHIRREHVDNLIETANSYYEAMTYAHGDVMESKPHAWAKHAAKDKRAVEVIAASIVDGGRPE